MYFFDQNRPSFVENSAEKKHVFGHSVFSVRVGVIIGEGLGVGLLRFYVLG